MPLNSKNRPKFGGVQCRSSRLKSVPAANQKVGARKVTDVVCQATDRNVIQSAFFVSTARFTVSKRIRSGISSAKLRRTVPDMARPPQSKVAGCGESARTLQEQLTVSR